MYIIAWFVFFLPFQILLTTFAWVGQECRKRVLIKPKNMIHYGEYTNNIQLAKTGFSSLGAAQEVIWILLWNFGKGTKN